MHTQAPRRKQSQLSEQEGQNEKLLKSSSIITFSSPSRRVIPALIVTPARCTLHYWRRFTDVTTVCVYTVSINCEHMPGVEATHLSLLRALHELRCLRPPRCFRSWRSTVRKL